MVQATQAKQVSSSAFPGFKQFLKKQEEETSKYYNMAEEYQKEIKKIWKHVALAEEKGNHQQWLHI